MTLPPIQTQDQLLAGQFVERANSTVRKYKDEQQMNNCPVAIIGAGPYGLSIAAHLKAAGICFRIFGRPMHTWITQMPKGMLLKSEGFASSLFDPASSFTLGDFCRERGLPYADSGLPVPIETFISYGVEFQKRLVPELETKLVASLDRAGGGFRIVLEDGEELVANKVVVAVGISHFPYLPPVFSDLPRDLVTHSADHSDLSEFNGREVAVIGAGASAVDVAALLQQTGAKVQLVARKPAIRFHDPPAAKKPSWLHRLRHPSTGIGPGWKLYFCANMPWAFRHLPESRRLHMVRTILGPAPGWFMKDQIVGKVPFHLGYEVESAKVQSGRVQLNLAKADGTKKQIVADHVIAATGYKVDLRRLKFLSSNLQTGLQRVEQSPALSENFETSIPGLYFVGTSSANTFGPVMRFAVGAGFAAQTVASHLSKTVPQSPVTQRATTKVETREPEEMHVR